MSDESRHFQSLSITILAIGTAALGFGLFRVEFDAADPMVFQFKFVSGVFAIIFYGILSCPLREF